MEDDDPRMEGEKETATLGYIWNLQRDEVSSTMDPAIISKKRGMSKNVALEEAKVNPKLITKRAMLFLQHPLFQQMGSCLFHCSWGLSCC